METACAAVFEASVPHYFVLHYSDGSSCIIGFTQKGSKWKINVDEKSFNMNDAYCYAVHAVGC